MKAFADLDKKEITLDNEAKKAIRFVLGYNTDLRVSLSAVNPIAIETIWRFLDDNRYSIFGSDFGFSKPDATSEKWDSYESLLTKAAHYIAG